MSNSYMNMNMNILLLTQYYKPEMGAPQSRLYEMLRGLKENGAEVSVVTAMPKKIYSNGSDRWHFCKAFLAICF